ncbi:MAG: hypothetical protein ACH6QN_00770 [Enterobacterales bacterium]
MKKKPILINKFLFNYKNKKIIYLNKFIKQSLIIFKINFIFKNNLPVYIHKLFKVLNIYKGIIIIEIFNYKCRTIILKKQSILLSILKYNIEKNIFYIKIKTNFNLIKK